MSRRNGKEEEDGTWKRIKLTNNTKKNETKGSSFNYLVEENCGGGKRGSVVLISILGNYTGV